MSTEIIKHGGASLAITSDQGDWTEEQIKALTHMGVDENVTQADLDIFRHVCQRTGLDPFLRQIHMVGRSASVKDDATGQWRKEKRYTIQTGIDGYRVIGRRAAQRDKHSLSNHAPEWCHESGEWRSVWRQAWGYPVAARVTITRDGQDFTAVALWDEYKQTKSNGDLNSMWAQRPAGQLAKCAEALAWRMAAPMDLAGVYTDDEMGQADNHVTEQPRATGLGSALAQQRHVVEVIDGDIEVVDAVVSEPVSAATEPLDTRSKLARRMFALMGEAGITEKADRLLYCSDVLGREIGSSTDLTVAEAEQIVAALKSDTDN